MSLLCLDLTAGRIPQNGARMLVFEKKLWFNTLKLHEDERLADLCAIYSSIYGITTKDI